MFTFDPGSLDAAVLALHSESNDRSAVTKWASRRNEFTTLRQTLAETQGDLVIMFGGELSRRMRRRSWLNFPIRFGGEGRRVLLHPLPLFNNSVGAHDMGMTESAR